MRAADFIVCGILFAASGTASAQQDHHGTGQGLQPIAAYDDLTCAARYTLAALAIHDLDVSAAAYYASRAVDAGKRYLALHPSENEQSYTAHVTADAQDLQVRLANNGLTPEGLVADIKSCDEAADTRDAT